MNNTVINSELENNATQVNSSVSQSGTSINPELAQSSSKSLVGKTINGKYQVKERMNVSAGEADMYLCTYDGKDYVAKVYRRQAAIKPEIIEKLKSIDSPYVAKTEEIGTYEGLPYEIMAYYKNGNMQGKKYDLSVLKNRIIPELNEALGELHANGIIHKDLKPSNIMLKDNGRDIAIIDFGVSSVVEGNNTVVVTKTGMTPEYSAPEALVNAFLEESDYYSLGITIYELFCGYTPFKNMTTEQKAQFAFTKEIPFPDSMPGELRDLIRGLTYADITHRNDKKNPNRRWTFEEVNDWCDGKKLPVPGGSEATASANALAMPPYKFMDKNYTDVHSLTLALAKNWEAGKKQLFRGLLSGFFKNFNPELAGYCIDAEEALSAGKGEDRIFAELLYQIDPDLTGFCWKDKYYDDPSQFGKEMIDKLRSGDMSDAETWDEMCEAGLFSNYAKRYVKEAVNGLTAAEAAVRTKKSGSEGMRDYYILAYLLSGDKNYVFEGKNYRSIDEVTEYMKKQLDVSFEKFAEFCKKLIDASNQLEPQFEAWLVSMGKTEELKKWRNQLQK